MARIYDTGFLPQDFQGPLKYFDPLWVELTAIRESDLKDPNAPQIIKPSVSDGDPSRALVFRVNRAGVEVSHFFEPGDIVLVVNQALNSCSPDGTQFMLPAAQIKVNFGPTPDFLN